MSISKQSADFSKRPAPVRIFAGTDPFFRELVVCFYSVFIVFWLLHNVFDASAKLTLLYTAAGAVCFPGILFAAGLQIAVTRSNYKGKAFRDAMLDFALFCYVYYLIVGIFLHVFLYNEECFKAIKTVTFAIMIPADGSVFLTLSALFLICALFYDRLEDLCRSYPRLPAAACLIGILLSLIPQGMLGYGPTGILIGGDVAGAVPLMMYLIPLFAGMHMARGGSFRNKRTVTVLILFALIGPAAFAAGFSQTGFLLCGTLVAFACIFILSKLSGLYCLIENVIVSLCCRIAEFVRSERSKISVANGRYYFYYFLAYTLMFAVVTFLIFVPYIDNGYSLIWLYDGLGQYVPKIYRFIAETPGIVKAVLSGNMNFMQYDFRIGLGAPMNYSFDPIYWLYLLFGRSRVETAYGALVILRYFLTGVTMSCLVLYFKKSRRAACLAGLVYAYSGYGLFAGTRHSQFITPMILFPLLVIAMEELIRKGKWAMMTLVVAISLLCSYYFLYMNTIAVGIYFVFRILFTEEYRNFKTFFLRGLTITMSYFIGAAIGFVSLVSSFGGYMGSSRSGGSSLSEMITASPLFYRAEWPYDLAVTMISTAFAPGLWLKIGLVPVAVFSLVLLFTRKNKTYLRASFLTCLLFCLLPVCGFAMSGFSSVTNRWCYIFTAVIVMVMVLNLKALLNLTRFELRIMSGITAGYVLLICLGLKYHTTESQAALVLLTVTLLVLLFLNDDRIRLSKKTAVNLLCGLILMTLIFGDNHFITRVSHITARSHLETYVPTGKTHAYVTSTPLRYLNQVEGYDPEEPVRSANVKCTSPMRSSSMVLGYRDISTFSSTLCGSIVDYNRQMGNTSWNIVTIYDYNFRTIMNELASVRYLGKKGKDKCTIPYGYEKVFEKKTSRNKYSIYENKYALPIGYSYDTQVTSDDAMSLNSAQKEEAGLMAAIVDQEDLTPSVPVSEASALPLETKRIELEKVEISGGMLKEEDLYIIEDKTDATMKFKFKTEPESESYLVIRGYVDPTDESKEYMIDAQLKSKGVTYTQRFRKDSYSTDQEEYVFNLGYHKDPVKEAKLVFSNIGAIRMQDIYICSRPVAHYGQRVDALRAHALENVKQTTNTLTGDITAEKDRLLVVSLPYQNGWTAYVDGKEARIVRANYQYMGIHIPAGKHSVKLVYALPGRKLGFLVSGLGLAVFILALIAGRILKAIRKK